MSLTPGDPLSYSNISVNLPLKVQHRKTAHLVVTIDSNNSAEEFHMLNTKGSGISDSWLNWVPAVTSEMEDSGCVEQLFRLSVGDN